LKIIFVLTYDPNCPDMIGELQFETQCIYSFYLLVNSLFIRWLN